MTFRRPAPPSVTLSSAYVCTPEVCGHSRGASVDDNTLEVLLNEDEGPSLDFKRDQYSFREASNEKKAELLKDLLAFANAWRRAPAYILVGVDEVKGGRSIPVGVTEHLNDNELQQFVNSKTNRPVTFRYYSYLFNGTQLGILEIPLQERPRFLKQRYASLAAEKVFLHRGSSTAIADPDEVAKIGASASLESRIAAVSLEWGHSETRQRLGDSADLKVEVLDPILPASVVDPPTWPMGIAVGMCESDYGTKKAEYVYERGLHRPLVLVCVNAGQVPARGVVIKAKVPRSAGIRFDEYPPDPPRESYLEGVIPHLRSIASRAYPEIEAYKDHWALKLELGTVLPGEAKWAERPVYLGADRSTLIELPVQVMAENIPVPIAQTLLVSVVATRRPMERRDVESKEDSD